MIKRIELVNFMSHSHTVIEPADGLTVLIGPNNCGKSAVVTALQILAHNANSTYVRSHNEKTCEIIVETDDGHSVKWSRSKNGSPRYEIDGQEFDRLKGKVPPQLHTALRLPKVSSDKDVFDIHFGQQKEPVFLLNDTGKAAAQFFASSSDAIRLVEMQDRHKTRIRESRRDLKRNAADSEQLESSIAILETTSDLDSLLIKTELQYAELMDSSKQIDNLKSLTTRITRHLRQLAFQTAVTDSLKTLVSPPQLAPTGALDRLAVGITKLQSDCQRQQRRLRPLSELNSPPKLQPTGPIENSIKRIGLHTNLSTKTTQLANVLAQVNQPPQLADEKRLQNLVAHLAVANRKGNRLSMKADQFAALVEPPEFPDLAGLKSAIKNMESSARATVRIEKQLVEIDNHVAAVVAETKRWAAENPTCPTCGSATEATRLLRSGTEGCHE